MSERGSFTTEYIYCNKCFQVVSEVLVDRDKYLCSTIIPSWCEQRIPIVAGKIGGLYAGEELVAMEYKYIPEIEKRICHDVRIAVLAESGEKILTARASKEESCQQKTTQKGFNW